jgi:hypothetical protein
MTRQLMAGFGLLVLFPGVLHADESESKIVSRIQKLRGKMTRDENMPGKPIVAVDLKQLRSLELCATRFEKKQGHLTMVNYD